MSKIIYARRGELQVPVLVDDDFDHPGRLSIASHGYVQMTPPGAGKVELLHRWLLGLRVGDRKIVDHINRDILDDRRSNLRVVDGSVSNANRSITMPGCVYRSRSGRWEAKVMWRRQRVHLGTHDTKEAAMAAVHVWRTENGATPPEQASV